MEPVETDSIITTGVNERMEPILNRMPVMIQRSNYDLRLDHAVEEPSRPQPLLAAYPSGGRVARAGNTPVNGPGDDSEGWIEQAG